MKAVGRKYGPSESAFESAKLAEAHFGVSIGLKKHLTAARVWTSTEARFDRILIANTQGNRKWAIGCPGVAAGKKYT
jgi:hypothetical protein